MQVVEQWGLYDGYDPKLEKVLRRRRTGRHMPIMNVIPPGLDFSNLKVRPGLGTTFALPTPRAARPTP